MRVQCTQARWTHGAPAAVQLRPWRYERCLAVVVAPEHLDQRVEGRLALVVRAAHERNRGADHVVAKVEIEALLEQLAHGAHGGGAVGLQRRFEPACRTVRRLGRRLSLLS